MRALLLGFLTVVAGLALELPVEAADADAARVLMYDNAFNPRVIRIAEGQRVEWVNVGRNPHNAVADDWSWSTEADFGSLEMGPDTTASAGFESEGVFPYFCTYHGAPGGIAMAGVVVVGDVPYEDTGVATLPAVAEPSGNTRYVPADYPTVQSAVDAAERGDLILIERGVYREEVLVTTPSIVIRGVDRNRVIVDGEFVRGNGVIVLADGVAVENITARNAQLNGFFWTGVTGYRGSYLTAYNNGDYGIYAFDSTDGLFEHSYASGSPDGGFYVGQCDPCKMVIRNVIAENNALGYSGTNSGGDLYVVSSIWRNNLAGINPNTLDSELLAPERETTVVANLVVGNNNVNAPTKALIFPVFGNGILVPGGLRNRIERNVVVGHQNHGIFITPGLDENFWRSTDNAVRDNFVRHSGRADLALGGPLSFGNCFESNDYETSAPAGLESFQGCDGLRLPLGWDAMPGLALLLRVRHAQSPAFESPDYRTQHAPTYQATMPEGADAPVRPAFDVFAGLDFDVTKATLPDEAKLFLEGDFDPVLFPFAAEADVVTKLVWRWSYYVPALVFLFFLALLARRRVGRGLLTLALGLLVTLVLVGFGAWRLAAL